MIGKTLAHYRITAKIGAGGMGDVYRATDTKLGRDVALKVLPAEAARNPERRQRFEQEAQAVAALQHPNIVTIHSVDQVDGVHFLTMELIEGQVLSGSDDFRLERFLDLAIPICDAVACAHAKGITHRDLKPANVMVDAQGRVKVLDFGLAKLFREDSDGAGAGADAEADATIAADPAHTQAGTVLGTAAYMSPEQAEGKPADPRSDVFSLGVLFYELTTGQAPFRGGSSMATIAAVLTHTPPPITQGRPELPGDLARIVGRCLEKDPARRFENAGALRDELVALRGSVSGSSRPSGVFRPGAASGAQISIVVLPFANLSSDAENEYFSDGLTEEVIADLSKVSALRVISRTSAMRLKGTELDLRGIAEQLDIQYALEGGVRKAGQNLRITAQLIDVGADTTLWSDKYSGTLEDVFAIQETVSRAIVDSLRVTLTQEEEQELVVTPTHNAFAYDTWLRARRDIWSFRKESLYRARAELEHARELVGDDVLLTRGLGLTYWQYVNAGIDTDPEYLEKAEQCARKVLELDPSGPHGPALLGYVAIQRGDIVGWVRQLGRAVELDPHDSDHVVWLGFGWGFAGYPERAVPHLERLLSTDPMFDLLHGALGMADYLSGRFEEATAHYRHACQLSPSHPGWPLLLVPSLASAGDTAGAVQAADELAPDPGGNPLDTLPHVMKHALLGDAEAADRLTTDDFVNTIWGDGHYTYIMAQNQALLGRQDEALRWLTRSTERCMINWPFLNEGDPLLEGLRGAPGFVELMGRVRGEWEGFLGAVEDR